LGVAIPVGCLVPLAIAIAVLVGAGLVAGTVLGQSNAPSGPSQVVVRVIDEGAKGDPAEVSTQIIPLR
jgi:hypothetical protein